MNAEYELSKLLTQDRIRDAQKHRQIKTDNTIRLNKRQRRTR